MAMTETKSNVEQLKESLFQTRKVGWEGLEKEMQKAIFAYCENYIQFLNHCKTEREIVTNAIQMAEEKGFQAIEEKETLQKGDKVYYNNRGKSLFLAIIGNNIEEGMHIIGSHGDSPRLDLKPNPVYEDTGLAYFKTHYYGGIKKYQWTAIPLAIHGVIVKTNGEKVEVVIGEDEADPIFTITDLLPHLAQEQMEKKLKEGIPGENLNLLMGSMPYAGEKIAESVKLNILNILNEKYGIKEIDFNNAELEIVPAFKAKSTGLDRSMVAGYGQDDRVCVYTSLSALLELEQVEKTAVCVISDKEEIGSMGNTGMESHIFENFVGQMLSKLGVNRPNLLEEVYAKSKMLSADVDAGFDPIYANVSEKYNAAYIGRGIGFNKYTGARGKSGASDANAEYVAEIRNMLENHHITYQFSELGRVDLGGGGTIAYILANKGMDVIDCGVPVLSMHAPYEVTSKFDIYEAYRTYKAFWENF